MATVIKGGTDLAGGVRHFGTSGPWPVVRTPADPLAEENAALRIQLDRVAAELERAGRDHNAALARARQDAEAEIGEAREAGRRLGLAAAETREAERLAALRAGIAAEAERFADRLLALDGLAAALARAGLAKVFHRPEAMGDMVAAALARHVATMRDRSALHVRVSGADFGDAAAVEGAAREAGAAVAVTIDPDLPAGACRLSARLGRIDLDVPGQWAALAELLDGMTR